MAVALHSQTRHVVHRPPWVRRRENDDGSRLALFMMVLLAIGFSGLILSGQWLNVTIPRSLMPPSGATITSRPTDGALPASRIQLAATPDQAAAEPEQLASSS